MTNLSYVVRRLAFVAGGRVIRLRPRQRSKGNVLLAYTTLPWLDARPEVLAGHTNRWECRDIAQAFLERRYAVDVIDWTNTRFLPKKKYTYVIDIHATIDRLASVLPETTVKVTHLTHAHWLYQNEAEYARLLEVQAKRGVTLVPRRVVSPSRSFELADAATILGERFTADTYAYRHIPVHLVPLSTTHEFASPETKDFDTARNTFVWFGGSGSVHKGLDLTLEAFAGMPEYELVICGKIDPDFALAYQAELSLPNVRVLGWVDPGSRAFEELRGSSLALIHPSCSEGGGGSIIVGMHAGLIPIANYESSVDMGEFGIVLPSLDASSIQTAVKTLAQESAEELRRRSVGAWTYAHAHHTRPLFAAAYRSFIDWLEKPRA